MKKNTAVIALVMSLLFSALPTVGRAKESTTAPNVPTTSAQPTVQQPVSQEDIVIVRLKDGADREKFDEALDEVHGKVLRTVSVGKELTFLYVQVEHGQAAKVEEKLSKNKDVSLAERNRIYHLPQIRPSSDSNAIASAESVSAQAKKPPKKSKKTKKQKKKKKKKKNTGPSNALVPMPNDPKFSWEVDAAQEKFTGMRAEDTTYGNFVNYCSIDSGSTNLSPEFTVTTQYNYVDPASPAFGSTETPFDVVVGWDAYHGTGTLSVAASCTNNGVGIAGLGNDDGQHCNIYVFRQFGLPNESPGGSTAGIVAALAFIANNLSPAVINLSMNSYPPYTLNNDPSFRQVAGVLYQKGSMIYNAAGNGQYNTETNPGLEDDSPPQNGIVRVAAVDESGTLTSWSNWGPQVTAAGLGKNCPCYGIIPGTNPTAASSPGLFDLSNPALDDGTSVAAPCVAGACACIYRALPAAKKISLGFPEADRIMWQTATPYPQNHGATLLIPNLQAAVQAAVNDK
jgi:hypothetical protein